MLLKTVRKSFAKIRRFFGLDKNIEEFKAHKKTKFRQDNFMEEIDFDYLEFEILEE